MTHYWGHLRQSIAFRIDFFDADIQIPETQLQALLFIPTLPPDSAPGSLLADKIYT